MATTKKPIRAPIKPAPPIKPDPPKPFSIEDVLPALPMRRLNFSHKHRPPLPLYWKHLEHNKSRHHPWLRPTPEAWHDETEKLAAEAETGNDRALFKLIRRDPRYLAEPVVIAKIFTWKLQVRHSKRRLPKGAPIETAILDQGKKAERNLKALARAIVSNMGKGNDSFTSDRDLVADYRLVLEALSKAEGMFPKTAKHNLPPAALSSIVAATGLSEDEINYLFKHRRSKNKLARTIVQRDYPMIGTERIRKLVEGVEIDKD